MDPENSPSSAHSALPNRTDVLSSSSVRALTPAEVVWGEAAVCGVFTFFSTPPPFPLPTYARFFLSSFLRFHPFPGDREKIFRPPSRADFKTFFLTRNPFYTFF